MAVDSGSTAFIIVCAALVIPMTPGLAFFYGGLVRQQNVLTIIMQNFVAMGLVTMIWVVWGFSLCFGKSGKMFGSWPPTPCSPTSRIWMEHPRPRLRTCLPPQTNPPRARNRTTPRKSSRRVFLFASSAARRRARLTRRVPPLSPHPDEFSRHARAAHASSRVA